MHDMSSTCARFPFVLAVFTVALLLCSRGDALAADHVQTIESKAVPIDADTPEQMPPAPTLDTLIGTCEGSSAQERQRWVDTAWRAAHRLVPDGGSGPLRLACSAQHVVVDFLIPEQLRQRPATAPGQPQAPAYPGVDYYASVKIDRVTGTVLRVFAG
jgi:hypothetical protein